MSEDGVVATDDETGIPFIPAEKWDAAVQQPDPRLAREQWDPANLTPHLERLSRDLNAVADRRLAAPALAKPWRTKEPEDDERHVVPRLDIINHDVSADCVCGPASSLLAGHEDCDHPDVWVHQHHALDGRGYPTLR